MYRSFGYSIWKVAGLASAILVLGLFVYFTGTTREDTGRYVLRFAVVAASAATSAILMSKLIFHAAEVVIVTSVGVTDRRVATNEIPWTSILAVELKTIQSRGGSRRFVALRIGQEARLDTVGVYRLMSAMQPSTISMDSVLISATLLAVGIEELHALCRDRYLAASS